MITVAEEGVLPQSDQELALWDARPPPVGLPELELGNVSSKVLVTTQPGPDEVERPRPPCIVEKSCLDGQKTYHVDLEKAMRDYIHANRPEFVFEGVDVAAVDEAETAPRRARAAVTIGKTATWMLSTSGVALLGGSTSVVLGLKQVEVARARKTMVKVPRDWVVAQLVPKRDSARTIKHIYSMQHVSDLLSAPVRSKKVDVLNDLVADAEEIVAYA
ncbi:hypothetical protein C8T65DRAFT_739079 [Cerioporus squamosus]|nr:hypothetical protein C8T65DRAFT_739079 [Cerioporus squamosus]